MSNHNKPPVSNLSHGQGANTPSDQVTQNARKQFEITDSTGRKITLRKPSVLLQYDVIGMIDDSRPGAGAQRAMVGPVLYVAAIDGEEVDPPTTEPQLRALLQRLGDDGYLAVAKGIEEHFKKDGAQSAKADGATKNS